MPVDDEDVSTTTESHNDHQTMARYHVFEVHARNQFPLSHKDSGVQLAPLLQHVLWAPNSQSIIDRHVQRESHYRLQNHLTTTTTGADSKQQLLLGKSGSVGNANYVVAASTAQPLGANNSSSHSTVTSASNGVNTSSARASNAGGPTAEGVNSNAGKPWGPTSAAAVAGSASATDQMKLMTGNVGVGGPGNNHQAIAFVHENDIYYKPKVQQDLVCRITTTGEFQ